MTGWTLGDFDSTRRWDFLLGYPMGLFFLKRTCFGRYKRVNSEKFQPLCCWSGSKCSKCLRKGCERFTNANLVDGILEPKLYLCNACQVSGSSSTSRKEQNRCNHDLVAMSLATNMSCCKCIYEPGKCFSFSRSQDKNGDAQHAVQSAMTQWPFTKALLHLPITARRHSSIMGTSLRIPNASQNHNQNLSLKPAWPVQKDSVQPCPAPGMEANTSTETLHAAGR